MLCLRCLLIVHYSVHGRSNILGEQMCAYLGVICIGHLLFGVQYIHYLNCRLAVCFKLFIICICDLLFAINYLRLRFTTAVLGEKHLELQKLIQWNRWPPRWHLMVKQQKPFLGCKEIFELLFHAKVGVSYFFVLAKHLCVTNCKYHRNLLV